MVCYYSDKGDFILVFDDQVYQSYPADAVLRCVMSKLCPKWQQPQLAVGELFLQGEGFFRKENQVALAVFSYLRTVRADPHIFIFQNLIPLKKKTKREA